jgi:hypothetical protein
MKKSLSVDSTEGLPVADMPVNEGVVKDLRITLRSSREPWRLITFSIRQVLRFFKHCFHKPASQALYESQLRPMLLAYL